VTLPPLDAKIGASQPLAQAPTMTLTSVKATFGVALKNLWKSTIAFMAIIASLGTGLAGGATVRSGVQWSMNSLASHFRDSVVMPSVIDPRHAPRTEKPNLDTSNCNPFPEGGPGSPDWNACVDLLASKIDMSDCFPLTTFNEAGLIFDACQAWLASQEVAPPPPTGVFAEVNRKGSVTINYSTAVSPDVRIVVTSPNGASCVDDGVSCTFSHLPSTSALVFYAAAANQWGISTPMVVGPVVADNPKKPYLVAPHVVVPGQPFSIIEVGSGSSSPALSFNNRSIPCGLGVIGQCVYSTSQERVGSYRATEVVGKVTLVSTIWVAGVSWTPLWQGGTTMRVFIKHSAPHTLVQVKLGYGPVVAKASSSTNSEGSATVLVRVPKSLEGSAVPMQIICDGSSLPQYIL